MDILKNFVFEAVGNLNAGVCSLVAERRACNHTLRTQRFEPKVGWERLVGIELKKDSDRGAEMMKSAPSATMKRALSTTYKRTEVTLCNRVVVSFFRSFCSAFQFD